MFSCRLNPNTVLNGQCRCLVRNGVPNAPAQLNPKGKRLLRAALTRYLQSAPREVRLRWQVEVPGSHLF